MSDWHPQEPTELDELDGCSENQMVKKSELDVSDIFTRKYERHEAYLEKKRPPSIMETNITDQLKNAGIQ